MWYASLYWIARGRCDLAVVSDEAVTFIRSVIENESAAADSTVPNAGTGAPTVASRGARALSSAASAVVSCRMSVTAGTVRMTGKAFTAMRQPVH